MVLRGLFHSFLVSQVGYDCDFVAVMKIRFDNDGFFIGWKAYRCPSLNPLIFTGELLLPPRLLQAHFLYRRTDIHSHVSRHCWMVSRMLV